MKKRHFKRKPVRTERREAAPLQTHDADCPASTELPADSSVGGLLLAITVQAVPDLAPQDPEPDTKTADGFKYQNHRRSEGEEAIAARLRERSKALHALRNP